MSVFLSVRPADLENGISNLCTLESYHAVKVDEQIVLTLIFFNTLRK